MKHFIIVKFNESIKVQELVQPIKELFDKAESIDGIDKVEVHVSNMNISNRHDLMIEMILTPSALTVFDNSEIHKQWKCEYGKYIVNKTIFDCN